MTDITESAWTNSNSPDQMLRAFRELQGKMSDRRERLLACACCRCFLAEMPDPRSRQAIDAAEAFADGQIDADELKRAGHAAGAVLREPLAWKYEDDPYGLVTAGTEWVWRLTRIHVPHGVSDISTWAAGRTSWNKDNRASLAVADALRDILGNPFRPVQVDPDWKTWRDGKLVAIARHIYRERDFASLPVFADALEEAGCTDSGVLEHCRDATLTHLRGCWALELILDDG